tara:strand:- start:118 stop:465 length:348 start_codon:yes stop_codon:yes gene_type:complete
VELTQELQVFTLEVVVEQPLQELQVELVTGVEVQEHQIQLQEQIHLTLVVEVVDLIQIIQDLEPVELVAEVQEVHQELIQESLELQTLEVVVEETLFKVEQDQHKLLVEQVVQVS